MNEKQEDSVEYFEYPGATGLYFFCSRYRCTLSVSTCEARWQSTRDQNRGDRDHLERCFSCPIGSRHAGRAEPNLSPFAKWRICSRCTRQSDRLISDQLCPSCYNRQREFLRGANGKGGPCRYYGPAPGPAAVTYRAGDAVRTLHVPLARGICEPVVMVLRNSDTRPFFGRSPRLSGAQRAGGAQ